MDAPFRGKEGFEVKSANSLSAEEFIVALGLFNGFSTSSAIGGHSGKASSKARKGKGWFVKSGKGGKGNGEGKKGNGKKK